MNRIIDHEYSYHEIQHVALHGDTFVKDTLVYRYLWPVVFSDGVPKESEGEGPFREASNGDVFKASDVEGVDIVIPLDARCSSDIRCLFVSDFRLY